MAEVKKLIEGYKSFYQKNFVENNGDAFKKLQTSQKPKTLIISCSDSRVDPAILTNADVGDIFVIRNVANLVPPYQPMGDSSHGTSAAIEFAVDYLKVKHIVIMGHSNCGGVKALIDNDIEADNNFSFITNWISLAKNVKNEIPKDLDHDEKCCFCEKEVIKISLKNLMTFPFVQKRVATQELKLHGWYFSIKDGSLAVFDEATEAFTKIN
ncbi:MAG: carbonic anhydrase [Alphaproteobacteria bacterium]